MGESGVVNDNAIRPESVLRTRFVAEGPGAAATYPETTRYVERIEVVATEDSGVDVDNATGLESIND